MAIFRSRAALALALILSGCGGGKGGEEPAEKSLATEARLYEPDWSEHATLPESGERANIFGVEDPREWRELVWKGKHHLLEYPVGPTGILVPERLVGEVMGWWIVQKATGFKDLTAFYHWLGLHDYPATEDAIPFPESGVRPSHPMGVTKRVTAEGDVGVTFGCATCHASNLFGRPVLGLSNRFPRANDIFVKVHAMRPLIQQAVVKSVTHATSGELAMLDHIKDVVPSIGVKDPAVLGLDTSLAQVGLSLARRGDDPYAELTPEAARHPRKSPLEKFVSDSKPAVWWNIKYKTRFLSDGSLVAGNPIYTNFLWNELGRGADLHALEAWLQDNQEIVREITAATFAVEAPRYTDFFPAERIDLTMAQKGEALFNARCARCHGSYEKAWSRADADQLALADKLRTSRVRYHRRTPVVNVGTDPQRAQGMRYFADQLNSLKISQTIGTTATPQDGYVPPPLEGIWARWPYFHNNSVPSLCAVLTRAEGRPEVYYSGEALDPERDFDQRCNGYPLGEKAPRAWRTAEHRYDTTRAGLRNTGHDEGIFLENGVEVLTSEDKLAIVEFLKTL